MDRSAGPRGKSTMRLKNLLSASSLALAFGVVWSSGAMADGPPIPSSDDTYISVFGGYNFAREQGGYSANQYDIRLKDGFTIGAAYGRHIGNGFRWESELAFVANDHKSYRTDNGAFDPDMSDGVSSLFVLGNIWKDFEVSETVRPYIGVGLGTAFSRSEERDDSNWDGGSVALAGQVGAGVRVALSEKLALDASYRARAAVDATLESIDGDSNGSFSHYSHSAQLGLSYALGDSRVMPASSGDPNDWYVSLFGGGVLANSVLNDEDSNVYLSDHKAGFVVGAAAGTHMAPGLRAEVEASFIQSNIDENSSQSGNVDPGIGSHRQVFLLANLWRDFDFGPVTPYIGGGLGVGAASYRNAEMDGDVMTDDWGVGVAGQFGFGARMAMSDTLSVDAGYRFKAIVDALAIGGNDDDDNAELAAFNHVLQVGVNYGLGAGSADGAGGLPGTQYVSLFVGGVNPLDMHSPVDGHDYLVDFKTGFTLGAALGSNITERMRGELELSVQDYDVKHSQDYGNIEPTSGGDVTGYFLMANLWRDMEFGGFRPYAGGGVGLGLMDIHLIHDSGNHQLKDTALALAAQVGSGIRFDMTDNVMLDVGYRFKAVASVPTEGDINGPNDDHDVASYFSQSVQAGVVWKF